MVKVVDGGRPGRETAFRLPAECPVCHSPVVRLPGEAAHRCSNPNCSAQIKETIRHFASKGALDIEGLGEKLVDQLVEKGLVKDYGDLYALTREALVPLNGWPINPPGNPSRPWSEPGLFEQVYLCLGHPFRRGACGRDPGRVFRQLGRLECLPGRGIIVHPGGGSQVARSVRAFFDNPRNQEVVAKLLRAGIQLKGEKTGGLKPLAGKIFV